MSRDRRQRGKQRARRRGAEDAPGELVRTDVPGALDHASGEVDEFDAALLRGAGGVPAQEGETERAEVASERSAGPATEQADTGDDKGGRSRGNGAVGNGGGGDDSGRTALAQREPARPPAPRGSIFSRAAAFLRASWAELQRVQWPDRPEVFQATAVVIGFVAVMGVYLGAADWVAQKIINFIL